MRALVFNVDAEPYVEDIKPSLTVLQELVGGYIEPLQLQGCHAYFNEEGKWMGLPVNLPATQFTEALGWRRGGDYLVGTVVFLGDNGADEGPVPDAVVELAEQLYGPVAQQ